MTMSAGEPNEIMRNQDIGKNTQFAQVYDRILTFDSLMSAFFNRQKRPKTDIGKATSDDE